MNFPLRSTYRQSAPCLTFRAAEKTKNSPLGAASRSKMALSKFSNPVRIFSIHVQAHSLIIIIDGNKISNSRLAHMQRPKMIEPQEQTFISQGVRHSFLSDSQCSAAAAPNGVKRRTFTSAQSNLLDAFGQSGPAIGQSFDRPAMRISAGWMIAADLPRSEL